MKQQILKAKRVLFIYLVVLCGAFSTEDRPIIIKKKETKKEKELAHKHKHPIKSKQTKQLYAFICRMNGTLISHTKRNSKIFLEWTQVPPSIYYKK